MVYLFAIFLAILFAIDPWTADQLVTFYVN